MSKLYTLDHKLLTETPEVRIGDKLYPVDDRTQTVRRILKAVAASRGADGAPDAALEGLHQALELAYGRKALEEIRPEELPFGAYQRLIELTLAAVTGEEPEARFPQPEPAGDRPAV